MDSVEFNDEVFEGLEDVPLNRCFFENCTFKRCKFIGLSVKYCRFVDCIFENCDFSVATFTGSSFRKVKFVDCKAVGVNWSQSEGVHAAEFISCKLNDTNFAQLDLRYVLFQECLLDNADFSESRLEKARFPSSRLTGAQFRKSNLIDADFSSALGYFFDPRENKLKNTKVSMPEAIGLLEVLGVTLSIER